MTTRRLRWQGPARTRACGLRAEDRLESWRRDWCVGSEAVTVAAESATPVATDWRGAQHGDARVWLGSQASDLRSLGAVLAGQGAADAAGLAERLARRAVDDLLARLLGVSPDRLETLTDPGPEDLAARHGTVGFSLGGPLAGHCLVLDAAACDLLVPPSPSRREALAPRHAAVLPERVSLDVALPLGVQTLSESLAFGVGEVLLAGPLAGAHLQLLAASGRVVATGALARSGEHRALRIEHRQDKQGTSQ